MPENSREKPSTSGTSSSGSSSRKSGKTGFFANLNPSRWTRGSAAASSSPNNNNNNNSSNNNNNLPSSSNSAPHTSSSSSSSSASHGAGLTRGHNAQAFLAISCKEQAKSWLKEQSLLFSQKYCKINSESSSSSAPQSGATVLPKLGEIATNLRRVMFYIYLKKSKSPFGQFLSFCVYPVVGKQNVRCFKGTQGRNFGI